MPRGRTGLSRPHGKPGTNNADQASRRDEHATPAERRAAGAERRAAAREAEAEPPVEEEFSEAEMPEPTYAPSKGDMNSHRRIAIVYKYELLNCPPESEWGKHGGTLRQIADYLEMPDPCDYRPIREVLQRHLSGADVSYTKGGQGRKTKLGPGEQRIAADCLRRGTGLVQAAFNVTAWRKKKGMPPESAAVSKRVVQTAVVHLGGVCQKRGTTGTGSRDAASKWAAYVTLKGTW